MHLHSKFHHDRTLFKEVRNLASRPFYIWRHSGHFECRKLPILKWAHIQCKLKPIVKTPYLYHFWFWRSSPAKISTKNSKWLPWRPFWIFDECDNDPKSIYTTRWSSVPHFMLIGHFRKITNNDVMAAILEILWNESSVKTLRTPICTYILSFIKIELFLRKLEIWSHAHFTYDVIAAILNVVNFQY